jgi:hypothetical protein
MVGILDIDQTYRLLKYIRAKSGDVDKAEKFVRGAFKYRKDFNVRKVLIPGKFKPHPILRHYSQGGHPPWGIDRDGGPVRYERVGQLDPKILKHVPNVLDFMLYEIWKSESMELALRNRSTPTRPHRGVTVVQDLRGLGFGHMNSSLLQLCTLERERERVVFWLESQRMEVEFCFSLSFFLLFSIDHIHTYIHTYIQVMRNEVFL